MIKNYLILLSISFLIFSCNWKSSDNLSENKLSIQKDTTNFLEIIKSYEPQRYRGYVPKEFYTNRGFFDWRRFPLVYPFSVGCIDVIDYGTIYSDEDKTDFEKGGSMTPLTDYFNKFIFDKSYFIAEKCKSPFDHDSVVVINQYFIFSFTNRTSKSINGLENLRKKLKEISFSGDTSFMTIKEYGDRL